MLEMNQVTKTFGKFKALDALCMNVPHGTVYGLVGPNGAGKSTAIRHLVGVYRPDSGTVTMEGTPIYENAAMKARIGFIPDDVFYFPSASLEEMRNYYRGIYPSFDDKLFGELYDIEPEYAAQLVGVTTVMSVLTIPAVLYVANFIMNI